MSTKIVSVCLMRKNSKRFPGKNTALLGGKELYLWTLEDMEELEFPAYMAHDYDFDIQGKINEIKRDPQFTGDEHKTAAEIKSFNLGADLYILFQVTSPFRNTDLIKYAINEMLAYPEFKCAIAATNEKAGFYYNDDGGGVNYDMQSRGYNKYNGSLILHRETGSFYIFRECQLYRSHITNCKPEERLIVYDEYGIDINTEEDLWEAEQWLGGHT